MNAPRTSSLLNLRTQTQTSSLTRMDRVVTEHYYHITTMDETKTFVVKKNSKTLGPFLYIYLLLQNSCMPFLNVQRREKTISPPPPQFVYLLVVMYSGISHLVYIANTAKSSTGTSHLIHLVEEFGQWGSPFVIMEINFELCWWIIQLIARIKICGSCVPKY